MLHQFLEQTLETSADKVRQARRLSGTLHFRAAEDPSVCVRISFCGDRIEIQDRKQGDARAPSLTADFLSTAHLTTGQSSPLSLLLSGRLKMSFAPSEARFLLRVLRLMRISRPAIRHRRAAVVIVGLTIAALLVLLWLARG